MSADGTEIHATGCILGISKDDITTI